MLLQVNNPILGNISYGNRSKIFNIHVLYKYFYCSFVSRGKSLQSKFLWMANYYINYMVYRIRIYMKGRKE